MAPPPYQFPDVFPPLGALGPQDVSGYEEGMPLDDMGMPDFFDGEPGDWYMTDDWALPPPNLTAVQGGPGNPIDYQAPWNVGATQSFPMYQPNRPPVTIDPNLFRLPPDAFQFPVPNLDNFPSPFPSFPDFFPNNRPQQRPPPPPMTPRRFIAGQQPGGMGGYGQQMPQQFGGMGQQMPISMQGIPYGSQLQGIAGYL